jgi:hypothetical protein
MRWFAWILAASALTQTGCALVNQAAWNLVNEPREYFDEKRLSRDIRVQAHRAWKEYRAGLPRGRICADDFGIGFREGYADYLESGGNLQPPAVPPVRYRRSAYLNAEGHTRIHEYLTGYKVGMDAAAMSGHRQFLTVPVLLPEESGNPPLNVRQTPDRGTNINGVNDRWPPMMIPKIDPTEGLPQPKRMEPSTGLPIPERARVQPLPASDPPMVPLIPAIPPVGTVAPPNPLAPEERVIPPSVSAPYPTIPQVEVPLMPAIPTVPPRLVLKSDLPAEGSPAPVEATKPSPDQEVSIPRLNLTTPVVAEPARAKDVIPPLAEPPVQWVKPLAFPPTGHRP